MAFFDPSKFTLVAINIKYRSIPGFVSYSEKEKRFRDHGKLILLDASK